MRPDDPVRENDDQFARLTAAFGRALAERDALADRIDKAAELLDFYLDECPPGRSPLAVRDARAILAGAEDAGEGGG